MEKLDQVIEIGVIGICQAARQANGSGQDTLAHVDRNKVTVIKFSGYDTA